MERALRALLRAKIAVNSYRKTRRLGRAGYSSADVAEIPLEFPTAGHTNPGLHEYKMIRRLVGIDKRGRK